MTLSKMAIGQTVSKKPTFSKVVEMRLKEVGFKKVVVPKDLTDAQTLIHEEDIPVKDLGLLKSLFTTMSVKVFVTYYEYDLSGVLRLEYTWRHPSGSNGYSVIYKFEDGNWVKNH